MLISIIERYGNYISGIVKALMFSIAASTIVEWYFQDAFGGTHWITELLVFLISFVFVTYVDVIHARQFMRND